jgi:hypothetical protein
MKSRNLPRIHARAGYCSMIRNDASHLGHFVITDYLAGGGLSIVILSHVLSEILLLVF